MTIRETKLANIETLKKEQDLRNRLEREQFIFEADALLPTKFSDENLDLQIEKIELRSGRIISLNERKNFIAENRQDYFVMFIPEFYKEMWIKKKWKFELNRRPYVVAKYTIELVYARFDRSVLPSLQKKNPYNEFGFRSYKHFQFLNEQGLVLLGGYINDAINSMKEASSWYDFRVKYAIQYGLPVQLELWQNETGVI